MEAYLDNSATTKVYDEVLDIMNKCMAEDFGNPSSLHHKGIIAEQYIKEAKSAIAKSMKVNEKEIVFTSGGTESNNMALIGAVMANRRNKNHIITTSIEHKSVGAVAGFLEDMGFEVTYLDVDNLGHISLEQLKNAIKDTTILVSVMYVNNEIGAVEPIEEIGKLIKSINPDILFHVDAIQAFGKYRIYPKKLNIDMMSVSGHKIHGPKGSGFLYVNEKVKIKPIIYGGGQQSGMRSGTENVPAIAGLGVAVEKTYTDFDEKQKHMYELKEYFTDEITKLDGVYVNGAKGRESAPHIVSVSFENVRSSNLLNALSEKGIYVSSGSACTSNEHKQKYSATLTGIGVRRDLLESTVRFSFSEDTTKEEIDYALDVIRETVPIQRRFTRK